MREVYGWSMSGRPLNMIESVMLSDNADYCRIARTWLYHDGLGVKVSTFFRPETYEPDGRRPTRQFETLLMEDPETTTRPYPSAVREMFGYRTRYATLVLALAGHAGYVETLRRKGWRAALPASR